MAERHTKIYGDQIDSSFAGDGLSKDVNDDLQINVDGSTLEISSDALRVKASGITSNELDQTDTYDFSSGILRAGTPVGGTDVANKDYVDGVSQGLDIHDSVRGATTTSITLSGEQTVDTTVALVSGDRCLVKDQGTPSQNGIYIVSTGAWTRATDMASGSSAAGDFMFVEEGTLYADTGWVCTNNSGSDIVGTNSLVFTQFSSAGIIIGGDGLTKTGNTLDVNVDNSTIEINTDTLRVKDLGIITAKINNDAVTEPKLDITNSPSDTQILSFDSGSSRMTWVDHITNPMLIESDIVFEIPSGTINSTNKIFTLSNTPVAGSVQVFLNGLLQAPGIAPLDYTISGTTITFDKAPRTNSDLYTYYFKD